MTRMQVIRNEHISVLIFLLCVHEELSGIRNSECLTFVGSKNERLHQLVYINVITIALAEALINNL